MDYDQKIQAATLRQRDAMGRTQFESPQGRMVSGIYVAPNPLEYLSAALRSAGAGREAQMAGQEIEQVGAQKKQAVADALRNFGTLAQGRAADVLPEDQAGPVRPAQAPNMTGAYQALLQAPDAALQNAGVRGMIEMPQMEAAAAQRAQDMEFKKAEAEAARQARIDQLNLAHQQRIEAMQMQNASREQMVQAQQEFQREMAKMRSQGGAAAQPYFQPVQTAQGVMAFNARTGRVEQVMGPNGQPIIGAQADPNLQGQITGAETAARKGAESTAEARTEARKADMFINQLKQAEDILKAGPTASGVGAAIDSAGRLIGASTPGAQRAGQLEALSGWLVANVPRMEGPQSNFDVQNYMTMAGKIGDRTVPVPERLAALQQVKALQEKYKASAENRGGSAPNAPKPRMKFDAQGNPIQ